MSTDSLRTLAPLVRAEPAIALVLGSTNATLAVAQPASAFVLAGMAGLSDRSPMLVVVATDLDAERLAGDLACFVGAQDHPRTVPDARPDVDGSDSDSGEVVGDLLEPVVLLGAWETLPFERVSPEASTMGRRMAVLWHLLGDGPRPPRIVVASIRALLQRLAPWQDTNAPVVVRAGDRIDLDELISRLVAMGYRREHQVEHRGELAVRGASSTSFPSQPTSRYGSTCGTTRSTA